MEMPLAILPNDVYRAYTKDQDPKALFEKAKRYHNSLRGLDAVQQQVVHHETQSLMIHAIFGSNRIERAGLGLNVTLNICQALLQGDLLPELNEEEPDYTSQLSEFITQDENLRHKPVQHILRGRLEIIQHMRAFQHMLDHFVTHKRDMTEELIKHTHAILCKGVSIIDDEMPEVPSKFYAGKYRTVAVGAGSTMFIVPKFMPRKMADMCDNLKKEIQDAEASGSMDPFSLAAKYSLRFVEIHPFQDGNGRMCRIILNSILSRFLGIIVPIGEQEEDGAEYMGIKKRASEHMEGHGEYATYILKKSTRILQKLKQKANGKKKNQAHSNT